MPALLHLRVMVRVKTRPRQPTNLRPALPHAPVLFLVEALDLGVFLLLAGLTLFLRVAGLTLLLRVTGAAAAAAGFFAQRVFLAILLMPA